MTDDTGLGRVVLGLDGFALTEVELVGGEVWLHVERNLPVVAGCPGCGVVASAHAWRTRLAAGSAGGGPVGGGGVAQAGVALSRARVCAGDVD